MMEALACHPLGIPPSTNYFQMPMTDNGSKIPSKYECSFPAEHEHQGQRREASLRRERKL